MDISVILCTYNRCRSLTETLGSVAASALPDSVEWEVLVVDNNSTDQTFRVVEDFCCRYPGRFRYVFEPRPGKSYALNAGIREAQGEVLAFTDDDIKVETRWLQNLTAALNDGEWAGSGGRTVLAQAFSPPAWLALKGPYALGGALAALFDLGGEPRELHESPFGANMAFHKKMFEKYGGFRTDLGPRPGSKIRNEDTEFGGRLLAAGERLYYEPAAIVYHPVPEDRIRRDYFLTWYFDYGRAEIRAAGRRPDILGIPRRYVSISKIVATVMARRTLHWIVTLNPRRRFSRKCWVWVNAGQIFEIYHEWRGAKEDTWREISRS